MFALRGNSNESDETLRLRSQNPVLCHFGSQSMKVLLVHPDDSPVEGPWSQSHWDSVIDLGWAGGAAYHDWERQMGCPVRGFYGFGRGPDDFQQIAGILRLGNGIL